LAFTLVLMQNRLEDLTPLKKLDENSVMKNHAHKLKMKNRLEFGHSTVLNAGSDALFIWKIKTGEILDANDKASELLGYTREFLLEQTVDIFSTDEEPYTKEYALKWIKAAVENGARTFQWKTYNNKGFMLWVEINMKPIEIDNNNFVLAAVRDITERMHWEKRLFTYQAQLRSLASQLSKTEERERRRIATVLHDHIGQNLVALKRKLELLRRMEPSPSNHQLLKETIELTTQTIKDTSSMTLQLSPPILFELGFVPAVEWLLEHHQNQNDFQCSLQDDGQFKPLNDDIKSLLFQSIRELLINVIKHAQAEKVKVSITRKGSYFKISVEDNGIGFEPSQKGLHKDGTGGFGLFNIKERLNSIGGGFSIKSKPGQGTCIIMTLPLALEHLINLGSTGICNDI